MNANFNEHFGAHIGGIGTEVHRQRTWGWVMYIAPKEEEGNLSEKLTRLKYRRGMSLCSYHGLNMW